MNYESVALTIIRGELEGQLYLFNEPARCVVGRGDDCDVMLSSDDQLAFISRHHCAFEIDPPHIRVRDLGSRNGTYVNGENVGQRPTRLASEAVRFAAHELKDGDEVRVCNTTFRVDIYSTAITPMPAVFASQNQHQHNEA